MLACALLVFSCTAWYLAICSDIAASKHEYWSSLAHLPFEVVISAGQKTKENSWGKCICSDIAASKHEYWSALAPLPFEVVISAGQKAKENSWGKGDENPE